MPELRTAALAASLILLVAVVGCGKPPRSGSTAPGGLRLDEPPARGLLRYGTFGESPACSEPTLFTSVFVNGPDYNGMEDNDLRGFLDGNFKYAWNQPGQIHVRVGRRGKAPRYGEHELFRVLQRWDEIRLPPHTTVEEASLTLAVEKGPSYGLRVMLYAVGHDWNPGLGGTLRNNVSPPVAGEVWWNARAHETETWGLPGAGFAADDRLDADTPAMPLAEASCGPGDTEIVLRSADLADYATERTRDGKPLLFLLKLSDFQEDLPGSVLTLWSGNQGDSRNVARRPALTLSWRSPAELRSVEKRILLEYGRRIELPRIDTHAAHSMAWTFESEADSLAPTLELRGGAGDRVWNWSRMAQASKAPGDWAELRLLAVRDPLVLGGSFVSRLADTWVLTAAPEEQEVVWRFRSPSGVEHPVTAEYEGNFRWFVQFTPDELGPWRYRWSSRFTPRGYTSPWGAFDVVLSGRANGRAQLKRFLGELKELDLRDDPEARTRRMIRFTRLERAVLLQETPESFNSPAGSATRDLLNEIRGLLGETVPDPIPLLPDAPPPWARK